MGSRPEDMTNLLGVGERMQVGGCCRVACGVGGMRRRCCTCVLGGAVSVQGSDPLESASFCAGDECPRGVDGQSGTCIERSHLFEDVQNVIGMLDREAGDLPQLRHLEIDVVLSLCGHPSIVAYAVMLFGDAIGSRSSSTSAKRRSLGMNTGDLVATYRGYLACLNDRRWDELGRFVADGVVYNGKRVGLSGYRAMLEADTGAIPDLQFVPEILLSDGPFVFCRLLFDCTPQQSFLGFEPTGGRVSFSEHVVYRFDDRHIVEVWSLIDKEAVREQISRKS
jgi:predicted ester cyclase